MNNPFKCKKCWDSGLLERGRIKCFVCYAGFKKKRALLKEFLRRRKDDAEWRQRLNTYGTNDDDAFREICSVKPSVQAS